MQQSRRDDDDDGGGGGRGLIGLLERMERLRMNDVSISLHL